MQNAGDVHETLVRRTLRDSVGMVPSRQPAAAVQL
jgi:hypothetical protein